MPGALGSLGIHPPTILPWMVTVRGLDTGSPCASCAGTSPREHTCQEMGCGSAGTELLAFRV